MQILILQNVLGPESLHFNMLPGDTVSSGDAHPVDGPDDADASVVSHTWRNKHLERPFP